MGFIDPNGGITPLVQVSWAGFCSCCKRPLTLTLASPPAKKRRQEHQTFTHFYTFLYIYHNLSCLPLYIFSKILAPHIFSVRLHKLPAACCKVTSSPALLPKTNAGHRTVLHRGCNHQSFGKACSFSCYRFATSSSGHVHQVRLCGMPLGNQF